MNQTQLIKKSARVIREQLPRYLMLIDDGREPLTESESGSGYAFTTERGAAVDQLTKFVEWLESVADKRPDYDGSCDQCECATDG